MNHAFPIDPVELTRALIRRPSVTPEDAGAMDIVQAALTRLGFVCRRLSYEGIENLYARRGTQGPNLCFAGHTDVVPIGDLSAWTHAPFAAVIEDGWLYGRGAADMKSGIAAWIAAVSAVTAEGETGGSLSLLITGDEEGPALHGTKAVVAQLRNEGERIDACVVGEPSSQEVLGDTVKIGRRGSLNSWFTVRGKQGHVAYPDRAANPVPVLLGLMAEMASHRLDDGYPEFQPSNLEITTLDVGNSAPNLIPAEARGRTNIRFNPRQTGVDLMAWIDEVVARRSAESGLPVIVEHMHSGDAFLTERGPFVDMVVGAVRAVTGHQPTLSTTGGTSDARFLRALCPVLELGLSGQTIHQVDERVAIEDIFRLADIYRGVIERFLRPNV